MFLDAGAEEIMVVAVAALIFVGPKDLPVVLRKVGQFTARMRGLAAEFRASFDEMARQSELDELKREVEALRRGDSIQPCAPRSTATSRRCTANWAPRRPRVSAHARTRSSRPPSPPP